MKSGQMCAVVMGLSLCILGANAQTVENETTQSDDLVKLVNQQSADAKNAVPLQKNKESQYVVQLGAFTSEAQALEWQVQLAQQNIHVDVHKDEGEYGLVKVRSKPFDNKDQAQEMALQLKLYGVEKALILPVSKQSNEF